MTIITHRFRANLTGDRDVDYSNISLPAIPGVDISCDRRETAPTAPMICTTKRKPTGCAIHRPSAYAVLRAALVAIAEDRA